MHAAVLGHVPRVAVLKRAGFHIIRRRVNIGDDWNTTVFNSIFIKIRSPGVKGELSAPQNIGSNIQHISALYRTPAFKANISRPFSAVLAKAGGVSAYGQLVHQTRRPNFDFLSGVLLNRRTTNCDTI